MKRLILEDYTNIRILNFVWVTFSNWATIYLEAFICRCSSKCPETCSFIKKTPPTQVFSCEMCEIFKNAFFTEHLQWLLLHIAGNLIPILNPIMTCILFLRLVQIYVIQLIFFLITLDFIFIWIYLSCIFKWSLQHHLEYNEVVI